MNALKSSLTRLLMPCLVMVLPPFQAKAQNDQTIYGAQSFPITYLGISSRSVSGDTTLPATDFMEFEYNAGRNTSEEALPAGGTPHPDPVRQVDRYGLFNAANVISFEGNTSVSPLDPVLAVGPNHVVQMINTHDARGSAFRVFDKTGSLIGDKYLRDYATNPSIGMQLDGKAFDPMILYDHLADRWVVSAAITGEESDDDCKQQLLAISSSPDPLGAYHIYCADPHGDDWAKMAVWPDYYLLSSLGFGNSIIALDRNAMIQGIQPRDAQYMLVSNWGYGSNPLPVDFDGNLAGANDRHALFVRMMADEFSGSYPQSSLDAIEIFQFFVDFDDAQKSHLLPSLLLEVAPTYYNFCGRFKGTQGCFSQPSPGGKIDPGLIGALLNFRASYRNFGSYQSLVCSHLSNVDGGNPGLGGIRWYELRRNLGDPDYYIYQQSTYAPPDNVNRFWSSMAMDGLGNMGLLYNMVSSGDYLSLGITGRRFQDDLHIMTMVEEILGSGNAITSERTGDYFSLRVDPSNDCMFWGTGTYGGDPPGLANIKTRVVRFSINGEADLFMRDNLGDIGMEPSTSADPIFWASEDIWLRSQDDGLTNQWHEEKIEWVQGQPVYAYLRVKNRGCMTSEASGNQLKLYWAKASTALSWPCPWDGEGSSCPELPGGLALGGPVGTETFGAIDPGGEVIIKFTWYPPDPHLYDDFLQELNNGGYDHFCLLARIETPSGMTYPETSALASNILSNNNVVLKNVSIVNETPGSPIWPPLRKDYDCILIGNMTDGVRHQVGFTVQFVTEGDADLMEFSNVTFSFSEWVMEQWRANGSPGTGFEEVDGVLKMVDDEARLDSITFLPFQLASACVSVTRKITDSITEQSNRRNSYRFDLSQHINGEVTGGQRFVIIPVVDSTEDRPEQSMDLIPILFTMRPNPATNRVEILTCQPEEDELVLRVADGLLGQDVLRMPFRKNTYFNVWGLPNGVYTVRVQMLNGTRSDSAQYLIISH